MLLWLIVVSIALAVADDQDQLRGSNEVCSMKESSGDTGAYMIAFTDFVIRRTDYTVSCLVPSGSLTIRYSVDDTQLVITCTKNTMIVCEELLEAKHLFDKYLDKSKSRTILSFFLVKNCELSHESLVCALGLVGADGSHTVKLTDIVGKLDTVHLEGLKGVTSFVIYNGDSPEERTSIPYNVLSILSDLQTLTIKGFLMDMRPGPDSTLLNLTSLTLPGNIIKNIPRGAFKSAPEIKELDLSLNEIELVDVDAFEGLTKLVALSLRYNYLKHLPEGVFRHSPNIARLNLRGNKLLDLSDNLFVGLNKLQELLISGNSEVLKLGNKTFSNLPSLSVLELDHCQIKDVPAELFQNSTNLQRIILEENGISNLPKTAFKGLKLAYLSLRRNKLSFLYSDVFSEQTSMTELNLSQNMLKSLPDGLFSDTHSLKTIYLDDNYIELLNKSTFEGLYNLKFLSLTSNRIENISQWIFECSSSSEAKDYSFPSKAVIDLQYNKIQQLEPPFNKNHTIRTTFLLDYNPFRCDCFLYDFIFNYRQRMNMSNIEINQAKCAEPSELKGKKLLNWQPKELYCDVDCVTGGIIKHSTKDSNCKCSFDVVQLKLNIFCDYLPNVFPELPLIYPTYLKLRNVTNIPLLPPKVKIIDVSSANLTDLVSITKSVVFNLTNNYFTKAPLKLFEYNCSVYLSNNPFDCSCEGRDNVIALEAFKNHILDYKNLTCSNNGVYVSNIVKVIDDLCAADDGNIVIISVSIGIITILIVFFACVLLAFKYRTELRIVLRRLGLWRGDVHGGELYDAFVSYAHQDENFVIEELLPNLERGNPPLKICIHNRDWVVGEYIPAQIARSVEQSRYTIIVLSRSFVDSVWGRLEFRTAHAMDRVIILMLEDLSADRSLDPELRAYFSTKTYVKADDPLVWERLRDAVLRRKRALKNTNENHQLVNMMATTNF